jgi:hypothetical protein
MIEEDTFQSKSTEGKQLLLNQIHDENTYRAVMIITSSSNVSIINVCSNGNKSN